MNKVLSIDEIPGLTVNELQFLLKKHIYHELDYIADDFKINRICVVGSRIKGTAKQESDLDIAFEYKGDYREDDMCGALNDSPLYINDLRVDFIPYSEGKGHTIDDRSPFISLL